MAFRPTDGTMTTWTGKLVDPLNLTVNDVDILDIAHALSRQCRFNGHCDGFISVANHCVRVSTLLRGDTRLEQWGLMHDAAETWLGDIITPLKYSGQFAAYFEAEARATAVVAEAFGLELPMPRAVKDADTAAVMREMSKLWSYEGTPVGDEALFLDRYKELFT